jgi:hypothetical protein
VNKQNGRSLSPHLNRQVDAVHCYALHVRVTPTSVHVLPELLRYRCGPPLRVDAYEYKLGRGDERVVPYTAGGLPHGEAGAPYMCE